MAPRANLSDLLADFEYDLQDFDELETPAEMSREYALALRSAWRTLHQKGIAHMLVDADQGAFFESLERAAGLRERLLAATRGRQEEPEFVGPCHTSDLAPFFDALASGRTDCAKAIARASEASFSSRYEYREDYDYARCVFALLEGADEATLDQFLGALDQSTEGDEPGRYRVCAALINKDDAAFETALKRLIKEHEQYFAEVAGSFVSDIGSFSTDRHIMVEGLGLKVLAVERGMAPRPEHKLMPIEGYFHAPKRTAARGHPRGLT